MGARRAKIVVSALFLAFVGAAYACDVYDATLLALSGPPAAERKGGIGWWSKDVGNGCFTAGAPRPEDRPAPGSQADVGPLIFALASMRLGSLDEQNEIDAGAWKEIGLDLDGVCSGSETCDKESVQSCRPTGAAIPNDGRYCRDNTFGRLEHTAALVPEVSKKYGLSDDGFNCGICVGHYNFLVRITGYNGEPNDDRVRVDLYPSPGLEQVLPWDCRDPSWRSRPCFSPDMPFTVQEDAFSEPRTGAALTNAKIFDDQAFVKNGYLSMTVPPAAFFWFPGTKAITTAYPLRIDSGLITGRLERGPDGIWRILDGVIAGRSRAEEIERGFRLIGFCETTDKRNYELLTTFVKANLDIAADGSKDPNRPCDAMSLGIGYTAVQATPGKSETVAPLQECVSPKGDAGDGG